MSVKIAFAMVAVLLGLVMLSILRRRIATKHARAKRLRRKSPRAATRGHFLGSTATD